MKPIEQLSTTTAPDFLAHLANRDSALLLHLQAVTLLLQENVSQYWQRSEPQDIRCTQQLKVIQDQFLFSDGKEEFDVPTRSDVLRQHLLRRFLIAECSVVYRREGNH